MPVEKKRLLVILAACGAFVSGTLALLLFVFSPSTPGAPAGSANERFAKLTHPDEYLKSFPLTLEEPSAAADPYVIQEAPLSLTITADPASASDPLATSGASGDAASPSGPSSATTAPGTAAVATSSAGASASSKPAPAPAPPKKVIVTEFWIQLTSLGSSTQADAFKAELARQGIVAVVNAASPFGTTVYRVIVGPYATRAEAEGWLETFRRIEGCSDAFVTEFTAERLR